MRDSLRPRPPLPCDVSTTSLYILHSYSLACVYDFPAVASESQYDAKALKSEGLSFPSVSDPIISAMWLLSLRTSAYTFSALWMILSLGSPPFPRSSVSGTLKHESLSFFERNYNGSSMLSHPILTQSHVPFVLRSTSARGRGLSTQGNRSRDDVSSSRYIGCWKDWLWVTKTDCWRPLLAGRDEILRIFLVSFPSLAYLRSSTLQLKNNLVIDTTIVSNDDTHASCPGRSYCGLVLCDEVNTLSQSRGTMGLC